MEWKSKERWIHWLRVCGICVEGSSHGVKESGKGFQGSEASDYSVCYCWLSKWILHMFPTKVEGVGCKL